MFGFVRSEKVRTLGGDVIKLKKRRIRTFLILIMIIGFTMVNLILYLLTVM
jgi:hypothetical protein